MQRGKPHKVLAMHMQSDADTCNASLGTAVATASDVSSLHTLVSIRVVVVRANRALARLGRSDRSLLLADTVKCFDQQLLPCTCFFKLSRQVDRVRDARLDKLRGQLLRLERQLLHLLDDGVREVDREDVVFLETHK